MKNKKKEKSRKRRRREEFAFSDVFRAGEFILRLSCTRSGSFLIWLAMTLYRRMIYRKFLVINCLSMQFRPFLFTFSMMENNFFSRFWGRLMMPGFEKFSNITKALVINSSIAVFIVLLQRLFLVYSFWLNKKILGNKFFIIKNDQND